MRIEHANITNQVVEFLKDNIRKGKWEVGKKIPSETQMISELGVSRTTVRSAVNQLAGLGLLETIHGKGTFLLDDQVDNYTNDENKITSKDCKDLSKVLEFRRIVESEACYLATLNVTSELIKKLHKILNQMENNKGNKSKFVDSDIQFHEIICKASDNPLLAKSMHKVFSETKRNHQQLNELFGYDNGIKYHTLILQAMENKDADKARLLMKEHLQQALKDLEHPERLL